jgi:hypothetical protein
MRAPRPYVLGKLRAVVTGLTLAASLAVAPAALASLSQGYATASPIVAGSLVALDQKTTGSVVVADSNNADRLFGVVVPPSAASISLGATGSGQVQVVTAGTATVFVTNAAGEIKTGDYITVSSIAGVGQKAVGKARVIGTAQTDFDGKGDGVTKRTIEDASGKREVGIGQIPVVIAVSTYTKDDGTPGNPVPNWLQGVSNAVAGKDVSPVRVIIAGLILLVALLSVTVLLYSAVRNSIISIGRNPLSKGAVFRGLLTVIFISAAILVLAAGAMYLVIAR